MNAKREFQSNGGLTQRAADKWESARFLRGFRASAGYRFQAWSASRPLAANANRWLASQKNKISEILSVLYLKHERNTCPNQKSRPRRTLRLQ